MKSTLTIITALLFISCSSQSRFSTVKRGEVYVSGFNEYETRARVVVVDSGLAPQYLVDEYMCRDIAHASFYPGLQTDHPHGTNLVSIIQEDMDTDKYCITVVRLGMVGRGLDQVTEGIELATKLRNTKIINLSLQGVQYRHDEYQIIKQAIKKQRIYFNVAAGNYGLDLDKMCSIYPACLAKRLERDSDKSLRKYFTVVGAQAEYSNVGEVVDVFLNGQPLGTPSMQGTSQATALYTNMMVRK